MLTQHNRKSLSPDYTLGIRELGVWSGDETNIGQAKISEYEHQIKVSCP